MSAFAEEVAAGEAAGRDGGSVREEIEDRHGPPT